MSKLSIKVEIGGRTYPLSVEENEKEGVIKAAKDINDAISLLKKNYAVTDMYDLLAMASLQLNAKKNNLEANSLNLESEKIALDLEALVNDIDADME